MIFIKFFLIVIVSIGFLIFAFSIKLKIFQKISVMTGYFVLFLFIIKPGYSDIIANFFSIKSGTDLIIYIVLALTSLINIALYVGHKNTSKILTKIIRETAKENAKKCK